MARHPGVRRNGQPKREWNLITGLPVKLERAEKREHPVLITPRRGSVPRWLDVISGAAEDRKPHAAVAPVRTSVTRVKTPMSPTFHLLMTLFTGGAWLLVLVPYMIIHAMSPGRKVKTTYR